MARPKCCRRVAAPPRCRAFGPAGLPPGSRAGGAGGSRSGEVVMTLDELEAIRLADLAGLYQQQAAEQMNVSRQTFGRIVQDARRKLAEALIEGKALRIEGGEIEMPETRQFQCSDCQHAWELPFGTGRTTDCPECHSANVHRAAEDRGPDRSGPGRGRGPRRGRAPQGRAPQGQAFGRCHN